MTSNEFLLAGRDRLGREVYTTFVPSWSSILDLRVPRPCFVLFFAGDAEQSRAEEAAQVADYPLRAGTVFVCAWGPGSSDLEDLFDEAAINRDPDSVRPVVLTTAHADESLEDALEFAITAAVPADEYADSYRSVLAMFVGNVNWHNIAAEYLEDALEVA